MKEELSFQTSNKSNCIGDVMVSVLDSSAVDYKIGICCFSAKQAALERKNTNWLARNQDNVSEWGDMSIHGLLFQWTSTITRGSQEPVIAHLDQSCFQ